MRRPHHLLYLQHGDVLPSQEKQVLATLRRAFPGVGVDFASEPAQVPYGMEYDAVICPTVDWLPAVLNRLGNDPLIHFQSAGVERIWPMRFDKTKYVMTKSSGVHATPMSEFVMGAMLYFAKRFDQYSAQSGEALWKRAWLDELWGRSLVVLGLGSVGRAVAARAAGFGMTVAGVSLSGRPAPGVSVVATVDDSRGLLERADYLVVSLPLTEQTRGLVDRRLLSTVPRGAVLVDVSRGGVTVTEHVLEAVDNGRLRGAALDVFEEEPLPAASPLWGHPRILVTPHVAGTSPLYVERVLAVFVDCMRAVLSGESPRALVDVEKGY